MPGKFGSIVKGDGASEGLGQVGQHVRQMGCGSWGLSVLWPVDDREPGGAFMRDEDGLAIAGKEHEIGFPMARALPVVGVGRALGQRAALLDDIDHAAALRGIAAAPVAGARQHAMPIILLRRTVVDEAID